MVSLQTLYTLSVPSSSLTSAPENRRCSALPLGGPRAAFYSPTSSFDSIGRFFWTYGYIQPTCNPARFARTTLRSPGFAATQPCLLKHCCNGLASPTCFLFLLSLFLGSLCMYGKHLKSCALVLLCPCLSSVCKTMSPYISLEAYHNIGQGHIAKSLILD